MDRTLSHLRRLRRRLVAETLRALAFALSVLVVCGCATGNASAERAFESVGMNVATVIDRERSASESDLQRIREYRAPTGTRVIVVPTEPACETHYFVNASGIISGFMLIGCGCSTYGENRFSEVVVIPGCGAGN